MIGFRPRREQPSSLLEARRRASYPYPYPTGWYRLESTNSLRRGEIRYLECLGKHFVLWRARQSGEIHLMDAFCPHLGANLARGQVRGDCIECPFHQWQFTGGGRVDHIPYSERPPDRVLAETYPLHDVHGHLFFYHRADGSPDDDGEPPPYDVPRVPEVGEGSFVARGHRNAGRVQMHIIEIAENAADTAHFQSLHGQFRVPWTQLRVPGIEIVHRLEWGVDPQRPWLMHLDDDVVLRVLGRVRDGLNATTRISFYGPGSLLLFRFHLPGRGEIVMYQSFLPLSPLEQQIDYWWFADRALPRWLVWYVIGNWSAQLPEDLSVWQDKVYQAQPKLCRDDGPVHELRRWYEQFLPGEHDPVTTDDLHPPRERR